MPDASSLSLLKDASETVGRIHLAEAISYRMSSERVAQAA